MNELFFAVPTLIVIAVTFVAGMAKGQSRMKKMCRGDLKKILLEVDDVNSANGSVKACIKPYIDKIVMAELKESIKQRKAWKR